MDNYKIIRDLLDFSDPDHFYFLQILKRRKDNPEMEKDMVPVMDFYIDSMNKFNSTENIIKTICDTENARAYFRINRRSKIRTANESLLLLVGYVVSGQYNAAKSVYSSASGRNHSDKDKKWLVDVDWVDIPSGTDPSEYVNKLKSRIKELLLESNRIPDMVDIPTKNGLHIITRPFRLDKFRETYKETIQKDNPTLLYCK